MTSADVLIVDDDEDLCSQLAEALQNEGFSSKHTSDPSDVERLMQTFNFKTAVLDYKMQTITGIDILRVIKKKSSSIRVFIVSGRPFIEKILREENVSHLVTGVIAKPFDVAILLEKLKTRSS